MLLHRASDSHPSRPSDLIVRTFENLIRYWGCGTVAQTQDLQITKQVHYHYAMQSIDFYGVEFFASQETCLVFDSCLIWEQLMGSLIVIIISYSDDQIIRLEAKLCSKVFALKNLNHCRWSNYFGNNCKLLEIYQATVPVDNCKVCL